MTMKKATSAILFLTLLLSFISSCSRGITTYEAANGKAKCGRYVR